MPDFTHLMLGEAHALALDLKELESLGKPIPKPADARIYNTPDITRRTKTFVPWLYDLDHGWTPKLAHEEPRPPLNTPPYFREVFQLKTGSLRGAKQNTITIDLRRFPRKARVFMVLPAKILPRAVFNKLLGGARSLPGTGIRVASVDTFNRIFGTRYTSAVNRQRVLVEARRGLRSVLDDLRLPVVGQHVTPAAIDIRYAVLSDGVKPKTYYFIHFDQFIDGRLLGNFDHIFQAYHNYDMPIIGDRRTRLAYRRTAPEVSSIPPMALAYFDSWAAAHAAGFDFVPRTFGRHYRPGMTSTALTRRILRYFNQKKLTVPMLVKKIQDNPHVDALGQQEGVPRRKRGLTRPTAKAILAARRKLPEKRFTSLRQIDAVRGVGPDTMSDIITSFLKLSPKAARGTWEPDRKVIRLLRRK